MSANLDATTLVSAYKKWATVPLETITSMRLEMAKFFFSVSTATGAFFLTTWQLFHNIKGATRPIDFWALALFAISIGCALTIFWPITYDYQKDTRIEPKHRYTLIRMKIEGLAWMTTWLGAVSCAVISTISVGDLSISSTTVQMVCVNTSAPDSSAVTPSILSCQPIAK